MKEKRISWAWRGSVARERVEARGLVVMVRERMGEMGKMSFILIEERDCLCLSPRG